MCSLFTARKLSVYRQQITLVQNFAAQAVIAIENARLLNELRQSLEQQTATSDVLQVISSSPGDLEPVFATMLENAVRICDAKFGIMNFPEPGGVRPVAAHNTPPAFAELGSSVRRFGPKHPLARVAATKQVVHIPDLELYAEEDPEIAKFRELRAHERYSTSRCLRRRACRHGQYLPPRGPPLHRQADRFGARTSPLRPSSPSRTRGCSKNCARERTVKASDCKAQPTTRTARRRPSRRNRAHEQAAALPASAGG